MEIVRGRPREPMSVPAFDALRQAHASVLVDVGCGDGAFPYRAAGTRDDLLAVGLDPHAEGMREYAQRAQRKPERGGRRNVLYVVGALEQVPEELHCSANLITIHFPWAALLRHILTANEAFTTALQRLAAPDSLLQILLNADAVMGDLQSKDPKALAVILPEPLCAAGFHLTTCDWLPPQAGVRSRWAGRLIRNSRRRVVWVRAERGAVPPALRVWLDQMTQVFPSNEG